jgi:hypothetical protein
MLTPTDHPCTGNPTVQQLTARFVLHEKVTKTTSSESQKWYPTCLIVEANQTVAVVNDSPFPGVVTIGTTFVQSISAFGSVTLHPALSDLLAPGVFELGLTASATSPTKTGLSGFGTYIEVWVEPHCSDVRTGAGCRTPG